MALRIEGMKPHHLKQVVGLRVTDRQQRFVGKVGDLLEEAGERVHPHVILADGQVVGFFLIDTHYGRNHHFAGREGTGLRGYFIGAGFQGRGYGKASIRALSAYLKSTYPQRGEIFLTVNCRNPVARHCYLSGGFVDSNELYHGGKAGPQHIMWLKIS